MKRFKRNFSRFSFLQNLQSTLPQIFLLILFFYFIAAIPAHPDEYSPYRPFACQQISQNLTTQLGQCQAVTMDFLGISYSQTYIYVGVTSSLLLKFATLVMNPIAAHVMLGFIFLLLSAYGLKKSYDLSTPLLFLLGFFPFAFSILRDGSPARISSVVFAYLPYLYQKMLLASRKRQILYWVFLNFIIFVAIEDKPFFFYLAPGLFMAILSQTTIKKELRSKLTFLKNSAWFLSLFSFSIFFLVSAKQDGKMYLLQLMESSASRIEGILFFALPSAILHSLSWLSYAVRFVDIHYSLDDNQALYLEAIPYGVGIASIASLLLLTATAVVYLHLYVRGFRRLFRISRGLRSLESKDLLFVSTILLFLFPVVGGAWTSHHFFFAHMIMLVLFVQSPRITPRLNNPVLLFGLSWLTALCLLFQPSRSYNSADSRAIVSQALKAASSSDIINCAYSCYFEYSLRNIDDIPITFAITETDLTSLVARFSGERRVFHICKECKDAKEFSENELQANLLLQKGEWSLYQMKIIK